MDEGKAIGDELGEDVGVEHYDYADDGGQGYRVPEDEAEDGAFLADLVGGGGGDADGLGVDHFAEEAVMSATAFPSTLRDETVGP